LRPFRVAYIPTKTVGTYAPPRHSCPGLDEALRSCGLLLRQAMERAETQHQINGMDAHYYTILE
jgi:hypothetical protein